MAPPRCFSPALAVLLAGACAASACGRFGFGPDDAVAPAWTNARSARDALVDPPDNASFRSIGVAPTLHDQGSATVAAGDSLVTFEGTTLPSSVGVGDALLFGDETLYVRAVSSPTALTLQGAATVTHGSAPFELRRAFNSLQAWEDARQGDLVGEGRSEVGVVYDDGVFDSDLLIEGSTTDADHFMWLTVALGHRHRGVAGSGARIRLGAQFATGVTISVRDQYVRIHWLEINASLDVGLYTTPIALGWGSGHVEISHVLAYGGRYDGLRIADYVDGTIVRNSIFYGFERTAISVSAPHHEGDIAWLLGNTIYGCGGDAIGDSRPPGAPFVIEAHGNLVLGSGEDDFAPSVDYDRSSYNFTSDDTAPGHHARTRIDAAELFVSTTPGELDLHLRDGAPAIDTWPNPDDSWDIDQGPRPLGRAWDVGADELR